MVIAVSSGGCLLQQSSSPVLALCCCFFFLLNSNFFVLGQDVSLPLTVVYDASWASETFSFVGNHQPFLTPEETENSVSQEANDDDQDGIWLLEGQSLPAGTYDFAVVNVVSGDAGDVYGLDGTVSTLADSDTKRRQFTVPNGGSDVTFFFDQRTKVFEASTNVMPVVCGDFMSEAGYFSAAIGSEGANWNPENTLGWLKNEMVGGEVSSVYRTYLHVPNGHWKYKICFRGTPMEVNSIGFAGTQFPISLDVDESSGGTDVVFTYDLLSGTVTSSLGSPILNMVGVMSERGSHLGERTLSPYLPSVMGDWVGRQMSFWTDIVAAKYPEPMAPWVRDLTIAEDVDGDGIAELALNVTALNDADGLSPVIVWDLTDFSLYNRLGQQQANA